MNYTNPDLERGILGSIVSFGEKVWHQVAEQLTLDDFGLRSSRALFSILLEMDSRGYCVGKEWSAPLRTVGMSMSGATVGASREESLWDVLDNGAYVLECADVACIPLQVRRQVADLVALAKRRRAADRITSAYHRLDEPGTDPLEEASALAEAGSDAVVWQTLDQIEEPGEDSSVASWGLSEVGCSSRLDDFMPLNAGRCYVLAGKPGGGKSSLAVQMMAENARAGVRVAFISMEMNTADCYKFFRPHNLSKNDMANVRILSCGNLTPHQLQATVRSACRSGCKLVVVDHMQYIRESAGQRQHEAISLAARMMVEVMKQEGAALIEICQMTREGRQEVRGERETKEKPPTLVDLRGSADLEQGASAVIFLWKPAEEQENMPVGYNAVEMKVAKNRWGPPCRVMLRFSPLDKRFTRDKIPEYSANHVSRDRMGTPVGDDENLFA